MTAVIAMSQVTVGAEARQPWQPNEFPIGYWLGPPVAFNKLETWQTVKDGNFTSPSSNN